MELNAKLAPGRLCTDYPLCLYCIPVYLLDDRHTNKKESYSNIYFWPIGAMHLVNDVVALLGGEEVFVQVRPRVAGGNGDDLSVPTNWVVKLI
jgi:hypothetical protein